MGENHTESFALQSHNITSTWVDDRINGSEEKITNYRIQIVAGRFKNIATRL
jgi:hypothetical protein